MSEYWKIWRDMLGLCYIVGTFNFMFGIVMYVHYNIPFGLLTIPFLVLTGLTCLWLCIALGESVADLIVRSWSKACVKEWQNIVTMGYSNVEVTMKHDMKGSLNAVSSDYSFQRCNNNLCSNLYDKSVVHPRNHNNDIHPACKSRNLVVPSCEQTSN